MEEEFIDVPIWPYESTFRAYSGDEDVVIKILNNGESILLAIPAAETPTFARFKDGHQYKVPCDFAKMLYDQGQAYYVTKPGYDLNPTNDGLSIMRWLNEFLHQPKDI